MYLYTNEKYVFKGRAQRLLNEKEFENHSVGDVFELLL